MEPYHPYQVEVRFGGTAKSPSNYWPPYLGPEFYPRGFKPDLIGEDDYISVLHENEELLPHPCFDGLIDRQRRDF